ncbi:SHOCT domain-containing protein [Pseudonocardia asaccharolytica]|uniref:SHOCT domain-containing protein n=1 Tax=Pseudonocardia asaccharolytica DSM 44247 = NBRC 16224 TaxID=1123024 RepID=A0A511D4S5_9PSEU|nr:SHOCT domain-containing protein [Pseudonocardia asaccharolytica]GEL19775.1 hypothetical protein PA7_36120 [Pseudonocardia asaccharolytica DSM 44247 = NBRC 16224]
MRRFVVGLLILVSALALLGSSTSLWTRRHVVNTEIFVAGTEAILTDPAVQARIETGVVATIMTNPEVQQAIDEAVAALPPRLQAFRPALEDGARTLLGRGVHALLTSPAFAALTSAALRSAQTQLINGQSVEFTLGQAKALVPADSRTGLAGQVLALIPDNVGITVLTKEQAPQVYTAIDLLKSLWLWVGLIAIAALIGALVVSRRRWQTLRAWAVTTGAFGLLIVLVMAVARGPLLGQVKPINVAAADAIYQGITGSLRSWTLWLVLIMAGIVAVTLLWGRIGIIPAIRRGSHAVRAQAAHYREERAVRAAAAELNPEATGPAPRAPAESWPHRVAAGVQAFVDGLNLPERLAALAGFLRRNLRVARWTGVAVGALVLLFWPSPTLSVLIWVAAFVALYIGLIELVLAIAARAPGATGEAAADEVAAPGGGVGAGVSPASDGAHTRELVTAQAAPAGGGAPALAPLEAPTPPEPPSAPPPHRPAVTPEDLSAMGGRLDLLMRLGDARSAGVLTEEEFATEKANLLAL